MPTSVLNSGLALVFHSRMNRFLSLKMLSIPALTVMAAALCLPAEAASKGGEMLVYFGTYTGKKSKGIYVSRLDTATGKLSAAELAAETISPSFLAAHPKGGFIYAVNEVSDFAGKKTGAVGAFAIDAATGKLTLLNQRSSVGPGPCHLVTDKAGKNVLIANYGGGSVAVLPVGKDGSLAPASSFIQHTGSSVNKGRQAAPHAHGIYVDAANRFAYVPDLGLDQVLVYRFDAGKGTLTAGEPSSASVAQGSGPRHFAFHPKGRFAYVINEMVCTVTAFACDPKRGVLTEVQTLSSLPTGESVKPGYSTAELYAHPSGKFLYGSNRGHDTIVGYAIDEKTGKLTLIEHTSTQGKIPRSFGIDPTGKWLLAGNQNSDTVVVFGIEAKTGRLTPTGQTIEVGAPVSFAFVPAR
jgi:6-phosphogluconolactonase